MRLNPSIWLSLFFINLIFFASNTTSSPIDTKTTPIPLSPTSPTCNPINFLLRATAHNIRFLHPPDAASSSSILSFLHASYSNSSGPLTNGIHLIRGRVFRLQATYCRPLYHSPRLPSRTLQLLVHGTTYNRTIWSGLGLGHDDYDYIKMATGRGYHILAVDILGHRDSLRSKNRKGETYDGVKTVQPPLQAEILHSLIRLLRHGPISAPRKGWSNPLPYQFPRVAYVGHGYGGGFAAAYIARRYPRDLDAVVHTSPVERSQFNSSVVRNLVPARLVDPNPERFGHNRNLPLTYLTFGNAAQRERAFYAGFYEANTIPVEDFRRQGTITVGEAVYLAIVDSKDEEVGVARGYKGPVMLVAGERDALFCGSSGDGNVEKESCELRLKTMTKRVWPDARKVVVYVARETGHTWMMHYSAKNTMWRIHNWLDGVFRRKMKDEEVMEGGEHGKAGRLVVQDKLWDGYDKTDSDGECIVALDEVDGAQCL